MARIEGVDAAREAVLVAAKLAVAAAYRAPQMTGQVKIVSEIVTGEDQDPIIEFFEAIAPISPVMNFDYTTLKVFREQGEPVPLVLLGADITHSELGWDCGACGFKTCAEFNKFSKENRGRATFWEGPSCAWKMMDFAAASDFACASAAQSRVDCRAMGTVGLAAAAVGYLAGCSVVIGIPIGPAGDFRYFSRGQNFEHFSHEYHRSAFLRTSPTNFLTFPGGTKPQMKIRDDWWTEPVFPKYEGLSDAEKEGVQACLAKAAEVSKKYGAKIVAPKK